MSKGMNINQVNKYLMEQFERLSNDELTDEELQRELMRTDRYVALASAVVSSGQLQLQAIKVAGEYMDVEKPCRVLLGEAK